MALRSCVFHRVPHSNGFARFHDTAYLAAMTLSFAFAVLCAGAWVSRRWRRPGCVCLFVALSVWERVRVRVRVCVGRMYVRVCMCACVRVCE